MSPGWMDGLGWVEACSPYSRVQACDCADDKGGCNAYGKRFDWDVEYPALFAGVDPGDDGAESDPGDPSDGGEKWKPSDAPSEVIGVAVCGRQSRAMCPGLIDTNMTRSTITTAQADAYAASFPIPRLGQPEEVADLIAFLATDQASYITGASLDIDGGDLMV